MHSKDLNKLKLQYEKEVIEPSAGLWERLEEKLDALPAAETEHKPKPTMGWLKHAAAVAVLLSVAAVLFFNKNKPVEQQNVYAEESSVETEAVPKPSEVPANSTQMPKSVEIQEVTEAVPADSPVRKFAVNPEAEKNSQAQVLPAKEIIANSEVVNVLPEASIQEYKPEIAASTGASSPKRQPTVYVQADELLFARELSKRRSDQDMKLVEIDLSKIERRRPSSVVILGITVYSNEANN